MVARSFVVFGLGKFGGSVAVNLCRNGCEVLAVDCDEEKVENIANEVTYAVKANVIDSDIYPSLGIGNMDAAVVAISDNMEASIIATISAKEAGIPYVLAKANSSTHAIILEKVGADQVIFPEKAMGSRVARNMVFGKFVDTFELSDTYSMVEMEVPRSWIGRSLIDLNVRKNWKVNVVAIKEGDSIDVSPDPEKPMREGQVLLIVGDNHNLNKIK